MNAMFNNPDKQFGLSMIEVLVTLVILMVGLLGLAGLQMQGLRSEMESYQRVQALILLQDMVARINANRVNATEYVMDDIGTGDTEPTDCTTARAVGKPRDICEWSNALKGSGETTSVGAAPVGAMIGGRGCITQPTPNTYQISVAWQGLGKTFAPTDPCGATFYGGETQRRVVSINVTMGTLWP